MRNKLVLVLLLSVVGVITGCGILDKGYNKVPVNHPAVTNSVTVLETNVFQNPVTGLTEQQIIPHIKVTVLPAYTTYELQEIPIVENGLQMVKNAPIPYAGIIGSILAAAYGIYGKIRNKKALQAVVTGIEAGREILQTTPQGQAFDAKIKEQLVKHQELAGVLNLVSKVVNDHTMDTTKPTS